MAASIVEPVDLDGNLNTLTLRWLVVASIASVWANGTIGTGISSLWSTHLPSASAALLALSYFSTRLLIVYTSATVLIWSKIEFSTASYPTLRIPPWHLSSHSRCSGALLSSFFHPVKNSRQRVCDLGFDFAGDHLLRRGGSQVVFISWSGSRLHLQLFNSLTVANLVIPFASNLDRYSSGCRCDFHLSFPRQLAASRHLVRFSIS